MPRRRACSTRRRARTWNRVGRWCVCVWEAIIGVEVSMRAVAAVGVVACLGCLVACGSTLTPAASTSASKAEGSRSGTVTGVVKMYGGPMDATTGKQALNGSPGPHWTVHIRSGSEVAATATSDSAGRFTV